MTGMQTLSSSANRACLCVGQLAGPGNGAGSRRGAPLSRPETAGCLGQSAPTALQGALLADHLTRSLDDPKQLVAWATTLLRRSKVSILVTI